jgi:hypothetical protein
MKRLTIAAFIRPRAILVLRVELSLQGISARGAIIATHDPKFGDDRERPVRIVMPPAQAADLVRRLQAVLGEL